MRSAVSPSSFPLGAAVEIAALEADPYPIYARLRETEPVTWVESLGMWYVTRYADVRTILMDMEHFTVASDDSLIFDTFGAHMLTTEGADHDRYRRAVQSAFMPGPVRERFEAPVERLAHGLIDTFKISREVELRAGFASRLPIQTILTVFGMSIDGEPRLRHWYDSFERALANFTRDAGVRARAQNSVSEFHEFLREAIHHARAAGKTESLLGSLVNAPESVRLSDDEIRRNMSIIFFGGISTVEALVLNALWALFAHEQTFSRVRADVSLLPKVLDETVRWLSPVQSATRHVAKDTVFGGVALKQGAIVNCMLGAANRDPAVFVEPDRFDVDRSNAQRHIGFAIGQHTCLGLHLAKMQARIALRCLFERLPGLRLVRERSSPPDGYEFRQSRALTVAWGESR